MKKGLTRAQCQNVLAMGDNKAAYNSCDKAAGTNLGPSEATYLVPDKVGEDLYFICGIGSHCSAKDMKVKFHIHQLPPEVSTCGRRAGRGGGLTEKKVLPAAVAAPAAAGPAGARGDVRVLSVRVTSLGPGAALPRRARRTDILPPAQIPGGRPNASRRTACCP